MTLTDRRPHDAVRTQRVLVGVSGGVDSAVTCLLLKTAGYHVSGAFLMTHDNADAARSDAEKLCRQLSIDFFPIDVRALFQQTVIDPFVDAWLAGYTPNPCVICNPSLKFDVLLETARRNQFDWIATGHYAAIERIEQTGRFALKKVTDGYKDQTYFLYRLNQDQLQHIMFPLGGYAKEEVRRIAARHNLVDQKGDQLALKQDSQDICFLPDKNYVQMIREEAIRRSLANADRLLEPGPIVNCDGEQIGTHPGLAYYTFGQRKGFNVKTTDRLFVVDRNLDNRQLTVGPYERVMQSKIRVTDIVFSGVDSFNEGEAMSGRIRSSAKPAPCRVYPNQDKNEIIVHFDEPVSAPTPGQSCVFYREQTILAGGLIDYNGVMTG